MRGVVISGYGGTEVLVARNDMAVPSVAPGESLIRVMACGVEPGLDVKTRRNGASWPVRMPHVLGASFAGIVDRTDSTGAGPAGGTRVVVDPVLSCGTCLRCRSGEDNLCARVGFMGVHRWGGNSEFAAVPTRNILYLPGSVSFASAAAAAVSYLTAWRMTVTLGAVDSGDTVLVLGGPGGLGIAAAQIAKLFGAHVIVAGRSRERLAVAAGHTSADGVLEVNSRVLAHSSTEDAVDLLVDAVGGDVVTSLLPALRPGARVVCCSSSGGPVMPLQMRQLYRKNITIYGCSGGTFSDFVNVFREISAGRLNPIVYSTYPLEEAARAHTDFERGGQVGKLVLTVSGSP